MSASWACVWASVNAVVSTGAVFVESSGASSDARGGISVQLAQGAVYALEQGTAFQEVILCFGFCQDVHKGAVERIQHVCNNQAIHARQRG